MRLAYERSPSISLPYRFFASGLLFAILAAAAVAGFGERLWVSRWSAGTVAALHLYAVGFMLQTMIGALFQVLPVAAGGELPMAPWVARLAHPLLIVAAIALPAGMWRQDHALLILGTATVTGALAVFLIAAAIALRRAHTGGPSSIAVGCALLSLAVGLALGVWAVAGLLGASLDFITAVILHAGWMLGAWAGSLLAGVAFIAVPMFQATPEFPRALVRWLAPVFVAAGLCMAAPLAGAPAAALRLGLWIFAAAILLFAATVLELQRRRRRARTDATLWHWRVAMVCAAVFALGLAFSGATVRDLSMPLGVLALHGVFGSAIAGMLYKIVPFLNWIYLQARIANAPKIDRMIPARAQAVQFALHLLALAALLAASLRPALGSLAGGVMLAAYAALAWNVTRGMWKCRELTAGIRASAGRRV
ncbi:MAG: hypothetical protein IT496_06060 [Gammaproteobacteria bacterium]|nr:hypothetical protein [Gammaproteobacteria bacterium]MCG3146186.1 hypothetical protein [Gammaproteobacteria bacterium]